MIGIINVSLAGIASRARTLGTKARGRKSAFEKKVSTVTECGADATGRRRRGTQTQARAITLARHGFRATTASTAARMFAAAAMMNTRSQLPVSFWSWFE